MLCSKQIASGSNRALDYHGYSNFRLDTEADILKNYMFSQASVRPGEAITLWTTKKGGAKERELAAAIRADVISERRTIEFLTETAGGVRII